MKSISMNNKEAVVIGFLARHPSLSIQRKMRLIMGMREEYRAIGLMIAGIDDKFLRKKIYSSYVKAADSFIKWADGKRKK